MCVLILSICCIKIYIRMFEYESIKNNAIHAIECDPLIYSFFFRSPALYAFRLYIFRINCSLAPVSLIKMHRLSILYVSCSLASKYAFVCVLDCLHLLLCDANATAAAVAALIAAGGGNVAPSSMLSIACEDII